MKIITSCNINERTRVNINKYSEGIIDHLAKLIREYKNWDLDLLDSQLNELLKEFCYGYISNDVLIIRYNKIINIEISDPRMLIRRKIKLDKILNE